MKKIHLKFAATVVTFFITTQIFSQQWTTEQKEVWENVEAYWNLYAQGDVEGYMNYIHNDYKGWDYDDEIPKDKTELKKWMNYYSKKSKIVLHSESPLTIQIFGNMSIVNYNYSIISSEADGKDIPFEGRYTDILIKEGSKWLQVAGHGGDRNFDK